jgi:uncharacterized protein (DUF488 family)
MSRLATIGYEGASVADFLATLDAAGITVLVDVRELPLSRRKGFSKSALAGILQEAGIDYHHCRALGDPKEGRQAARAGRYAEFRKIYAQHIKTTEAKTALDEILEIVASNNVCLLCYERDPNQCHRTIVANILADRGGIGVVHLGIRAGAAKRGPTKIRHRAGGSAGQGVAAAE